MTQILAIVASVVVILAVVGLAMIWALNTLFGLGIAYTFKTWCAAFLLSVIVGGSSTTNKVSR